MSLIIPNGAIAMFTATFEPLEKRIFPKRFKTANLYS
ncbi:unannotated protein [freshwater metagenome]